MRHRAFRKTLFREHVPHAEVWSYSSRINGTSQDASDLDLAVRGPGLRPVGESSYSSLEALQLSNLPILAQDRSWAKLPERFHCEIERNYIAVQRDGPDC